jgi:glycosyltransferase involved in cell wall biosynthesis
MISVVVPTRDRPEALARCLAALARQRGAELEVIVVDDGAEPAVAPGARIVRAAGAGPAAARNLGARTAHGDVVCFTDDDCVPAPEWAQRLAAACANGGAAAGTTLADPAASPAEAAAQLLTNSLMLSSREQTPEGVALRFAPTCNLACHATTLRALPFDESSAVAAGEDREWCARLRAAGVPLRHVPDAAVVHRPLLGMPGLVRQGLRYGHGAIGSEQAGAALAGAPFYRRLARASAEAGPRTAAYVALAQASVAAGAALKVAKQRLAR